MIEPEIRSHIAATLARVAAEEDVRILFAVESGSRAWGFGSPDSDYDVRFVYANPRDWYIALAEPRDVIERPLDDKLVDLAGWDIRKALRLLLRSNPALYEWLVSPISYIDDGDARPALIELFERHASPRALAHHYWSIARTQWRTEVDGKSEVRLKKYFYLIRPLLSLAWIATHRTPPPMHMDALRDGGRMPPQARDALDQLLAMKRSTPEFGLGARAEALDEWIAAELDRLAPERLALPDTSRPEASAAADSLYRRLIGA